MIANQKFSRWVLFGWLTAASIAAYGADPAAPVQASSEVKVRGPEALESHPAVKPAPGPGSNDAKVATLLGKILETSHYSQQKLDDAMSARFLDRYIETLDNQRIHFTDSDLAEFEIYRTRLDDLIRRGDVRPAHMIFGRFLERLQQRVDYVNELLKNETFDFTGDDRFVIDRRQAPRPADLSQAKSLWRDRLRYEYLQERLLNKKSDDIAPFLNKRYARLIRTLKEYDSDDILQIYLSALTHVYDPHTDYFGKSELDTFSINMKLSLFGIGAQLISEDGYCKIRELVAGGPAAQSKQLKPQDRIIAVAQGDKEPVDVVDMKLTKVVEMIRGPKGTEVRLTIIPADAADPSVHTVVTLIRDEIKLEDQEAKAKIIDVPDPSGTGRERLGVIDLPSFYADFDTLFKRGTPEHKSTTTDVAKLLKKLVQEKVDGIVLDLRRNGGGSLEEAINLTGLFIRQGPVVQVRDSKGDTEVDEDKDPTILYDGPLVVLTSRFSASASEILAAALQDYGRAVIVGDSSTHGKGTVQSLLKLEPIMRSTGMEIAGMGGEPGALKITIRKFYRPKGGSTQLKGVIPDLILPSLNNYAELGEAYLDNPLPWDSVQPVRFQPVNRVQNHLSELRRRSAQRVDTDQDFVYLREDIEQYKKALADKSVSLNEEKRRQEKVEAEARRKKRETEITARKPLDQTVYELPLKQAVLPGLPAPVVKTNEVATATKDKDRDGDEDATEHLATPHIPPVDYTMEEAKRILLDLVSLSTARVSIAGKQ